MRVPQALVSFPDPSVLIRRAVMWVAAWLLAIVAACGARPATLSAQRAPSDAVSSSAVRWTVGTLPHLDAWLHAFAMLSNDSARAPTVPLYVRGYRDSLLTVRQQANTLTALDGNQAALVDGLAKSGGYLDAQFLPFAFSNGDTFRRATEQFLQAQGDPRRAPTREAQQDVARFASVFPGGSDREWLRLFTASVLDERIRFYDADYMRATRDRQRVQQAVDSLWQVHAPAFERFLNNSGQRQGQLVLTLPIGGEGRTGEGRAESVRGPRTMVAVPFPTRPVDAAQALYVFAHELTGTLVGPVVADNVTPAEQRAGVAARYTSAGQVIAGGVLLARVAPTLRAGYERYYLAQVGVPVTPTADAHLLFERTFVLPAALKEALEKQIDLVLGGI